MAEVEQIVLALYKEFGIGILVTLVLLIVSWKADEAVHPNVRKVLANFLLADGRSANYKVLPETFLKLFDATFGARALSWKFILRSFATSALCLVLMMLIWIVFLGRLGTSEIVAVLAIGAMLNLIPDYISLVESRLILRNMVGKIKHQVLSLLILDLVLTTLIFALAFFLFQLISQSPSSGGSVQRFWDTYYEFLWNGIRLAERNGELGIFLYTTYFTSIWVWLYILSAMTMRTRGMMKPLRKILPISSRPFRSLGLVSFLPAVGIAILLGTVFGKVE